MKDLTFHEVVRLRRSYRGFQSNPVPMDTIDKVLQDAQLSPSNCNTQPWHVHIVSGDKLQALSNSLTQAHKNGEMSPDFTFDTSHYTGRFKERQFHQGKTYYEGLGVVRQDKAGREKANLKNYTFYNAPHVALLFMPTVGDDVRVAGDIGMYGQTFLLSLVAHGLAGVPQTVLGLFADVIRKELDIDNSFKMLFGISFGYPDADSPNNAIKMLRDPIESNVTFHQ